MWGALTSPSITLGLRYLITAMAFLLVGGIEALAMSLQLAQPGVTLLSPESYNQMYTMHGSALIYWYAGPILSGLAVYMVALLIGARDMAFPRANAFGYWTFLFSGIFLYTSLFIGQAPHAGWFAYAPYTLKKYSPALGMDYFAIAFIFLTISQTVGAINFLVTTFRDRAPGMSVNRMPLFLYSTGTSSVLSIIAMPSRCVAYSCCSIVTGIRTFSTSPGAAARSSGSSSPGYSGTRGLHHFPTSDRNHLHAAARVLSAADRRVRLRRARDGAHGRLRCS